MNVVSELRKLRSREHACTVEIISMLVRCHAEKLYLDHGCPTMWEFLVRELKYSNAAASRRYKAMKCVAKFPRVLDMLREHEISLSTLAQAEPLLGEVTDPQEFLDRISGKSHREVEKIVARERPVPQRPREVVRRVAVRAAADPLFAAEPSGPVEERVSLRTSLSQEQYDKFERARAIVSRKNPAARVEDVLVELVEFYLSRKAPRKRKPAKPARSRTRHIPAATRDEVMLRDGERCSFVGANGRRCNSRHNLQIDHIRPWARGGGHEAENLRVLCAAHNQHEARRHFSSVPAPEVKEGRREYRVGARASVAAIRTVQTRSAKEGTQNTIYSTADMYIRNCHILNGGPPTIRGRVVPGNGFIDVRDDGWGTSDLDPIASWIDDTQGTVLRQPILSEPVPTEKESVGGLKGRFRRRN